MNLSTVVTMAIAGLEVSITKENSQTKCERELIGSKFIQGFSNNVENSLWRSLRAYTVTQRLERELSLRGSCRIMCRIMCRTTATVSLVMFRLASKSESVLALDCDFSLKNIGPQLSTTMSAASYSYRDTRI